MRLMPSVLRHLTDINWFLKYLMTAVKSRTKMAIGRKDMVVSLKDGLFKR